jgi:hypothetical protein
MFTPLYSNRLDYRVAMHGDKRQECEDSAAIGDLMMLVICCLNIFSTEQYYADHSHNYSK